MKVSFTVLALVAAGLVGEARAAYFDALFELQGTNRQPGLIEEVRLVDITSSSPDRYITSSLAASQADIVVSNIPLASKSNLGLNESGFFPFVAMDVSGLERYTASLPDDMRALTVLGVRLYQAGDLEPSLALLEKVRSSEPFDRRSAELYPAMLIKAKRIPEGAEAALRALDYLPENEVVRFNLACALSMMGRHEEALHHLHVLARMEWPDLVYYLSDPDLDNIRRSPTFGELETLIHQALRERVINDVKSFVFAPNL